MKGLADTSQKSAPTKYVACLKLYFHYQVETHYLGEKASQGQVHIQMVLEAKLQLG